MKTYMIVVISADRIGNNDTTDEEYIMTSLVDKDIGEEIIENIKHCEIRSVLSHAFEDLVKIISRK